MNIEAANILLYLFHFLTLFFHCIYVIYLMKQLLIFNLYNYYPYGRSKFGDRKQFAKIYNKFPNEKRKMFYYYVAFFSRIIILNPNKN